MTNMKKFYVDVREVWVQTNEVKAETAEEAKKKVADGEGKQVEGMLEYSHTLDPETWTVCEVEE